MKYLLLLILIGCNSPTAPSFKASADTNNRTSVQGYFCEEFNGREVCLRNQFVLWSGYVKSVLEYRNNNFLETQWTQKNDSLFLGLLNPAGMDSSGFAHNGFADSVVVVW